MGMGRRRHEKLSDAHLTYMRYTPLTFWEGWRPKLAYARIFSSACVQYVNSFPLWQRM